MRTLPPGTLLTLADAYAEGLVASTIQRRVRTGEWQMVLPDVLLTRAGPLTSAQQRGAALLWGGPTAALSSATAATVDGLQGYADPRVHLALPRGSGLRSRGFVVVRRNLDEQDVHPTRSPRRTRIERSVIDLTGRAATLDDAVAVLAAAVQQMLTRPGHLRHVLDHQPKSRFRRQLLDVLLDLEGGTHSLPELQAIRVIRAAGLQRPTRQAVRFEGGRRRYLDLFWDYVRLCVEIDGAFHLTLEQWWADMLRDAELTIDGVRVVRVPAFVVRHHPALFTSLVGRLLAVAA